MRAFSVDAEGSMTAHAKNRREGISSTPHVEGDGGGGSPLRLDRRRAARVPAVGVSHATFSDGLGRFGVARLELIDRSFEGLGVRTDTGLPVGARVSICPPGGSVPTLTTIVVRCEPEQGGYRLGLSYDSRANAA